MTSPALQKRSLAFTACTLPAAAFVLAGFFVAVFFAVGFTAAAPLARQQAMPQAAPQEKPEQSAPTSPEKSEPERGYAAFYSPSLEGHKTACGGVYSPDKLTAAHRSLPCGTRLRVTNLRNSKTVHVTITDHGPLSHGRILDLSYAAARRLDFIKQGTTLVKVEIIR